jgi:hypothetical protein
MSNLKDIVNEEIENMLNEIAWQENIITHINEYRIPIIGKISEILFGNHRITSFHISDTKNIDNMKNVIRTKKVISTFTEADEDMIEDLGGIQTGGGGILYEIFGNLVFKSKGDSMSRPDQFGLRWLSPKEIMDNKLQSIWKELANKLAYEDEKKQYFIKKYFMLAEQFINDHIDEIYNHLKSFYNQNYSWNEILVRNIEVHDVYWNGNNWGYYHSGDNSKVREIIKELESFTTGTVYGPGSGMNSIKFYNDRVTKDVETNLDLKTNQPVSADNTDKYF